MREFFGEVYRAIALHAHGETEYFGHIIVERIFNLVLDVIAHEPVNYGCGLYLKYKSDAKVGNLRVLIHLPTNFAQDWVRFHASQFHLDHAPNMFAISDKGKDLNQLFTTYMDLTARELDCLQRCVGQNLWLNVLVVEVLCSLLQDGLLNYLADYVD